MIFEMSENERIAELRAIEHEKAIEQAQRTAAELKKQYNAPVVWKGGTRFIIITGGTEVVVLA